ncbi:hypothetical protein ACNFG0_06380 [Pseudomonas sp. NY15372]|uniref:hypothetical protein n=1 Tax=Pseudomonas sp. NY15372 TaxID=3400356 RepID=UPI003A844E85
MNRRQVACSLAACLACTLQEQAHALDALTAQGVTIQPQLETGLAYIDNTQQGFGARTSFYGYPIDRNGARWEGFVKGGAQLTYPLTDGLLLKGKFNVVSSANQGDSDGLGYTRDNPRDTDWDEAFISLERQQPLGPFDTASISLGRVPYMIGDGFLIGDGQGTIDQGHQGGYWINPRKAFDQAAIVRLDSGGLRTELFALQTRLDVDVADYQERIRLRGLNLEYSIDDHDRLGATWMRAQDDALDSRDGLTVSDLRFSTSPFTQLPGLSLAGEYAWQENHGQHAHAWYAQGSYHFTDAPLTPELTYRYSVFSDTYDSLLYGYGGAWGTWIQGEIVGENMLFNMNQKTHMVRLELHPHETLKVGVAAFDFRFYERPAGVSNDRFAREFNLYADWAPDDHWSLGILYGRAAPQDGAGQYFASQHTSNLLEAYALYTF